MRVLVCGGRDFNDSDFIHNQLCDLNAERGPFSVVIHGYAAGADHEANNWAQMMGLKIAGYRAEWQRYGNSAGPRRNQRMLDEGKPDLVVAFPGGRGTADMVRRAKAAQIEVLEITR